MEFPKKIAGPLNLVPFLVPVDKKIHKTKFEIEEQNTELQMARKLPLQPLSFWLFKWSEGQISQIVNILRDFIEANLRKLRAKPN